MKTIVYLIRHSVRLNNKEMIESYKTTQNALLKNEKIVLSVTGEKRAEILSNEEEFLKLRDCNADLVIEDIDGYCTHTASYCLGTLSSKLNI